jgi:hypothetical protein
VATNIESRIERLEAKLLAVSGIQDVMIIHIVDRTGQTDDIDIYRDMDGHTLPRNRGEDSEAFQERAKRWVWEEFPPADPRSICALLADNSERRRASPT